MDDARYTAEEQALFDRELEKQLRAELPSLREEEIKAAAQRAAALELEQRRGALRQQLDSEVEVTAAESSTELRQEANREAPSKLLVGLILLLLLLFILAISGRLPFGSAGALSASGAAGASGSNSDPLTSQLLGGGPTATPVGMSAAGDGTLVDSQTGRGPVNAGDVDPLGSIPGIDANVSQLFRPYYIERGGLRVFGYPISQLLTVNGRQVQWFERARLEYWPEYQNTPYQVQPGLIGMEYTNDREFPRQAFFTSRPGLRYFGETSHGVGGKFLDFWEAHGGLDVFGYPISDEVVEILPETGRYHTVQYFQRARMELHPEYAGTQDEVQLGLLGRILHLKEDRSTLIVPVAPTPVPLP